MNYNPVHLTFLAKIFKQTVKNVQRAIRSNNINTTELYQVCTQKVPDRNKFYEIVNNEAIADHWWSTFMDEYWLELYEREVIRC